MIASVTMTWIHLLEIRISLGLTPHCDGRSRRMKSSLLTALGKEVVRTKRVIMLTAKTKFHHHHQLGAIGGEE